jgi:hypothetical protein
MSLSQLNLSRLDVLPLIVLWELVEYAKAALLRFLGRSHPVG